MVATTETRTETVAVPEARTEKGVSLARGPALIVGTILLAVGLYALYREHTFPPFSNLPNGHAPIESKVLGIFGANGWTGMLTAVAGGLLLFGAAQHLLAKTMSLIVGAALGAAAIIALVSGNVLGMAAANGWTELAWAIAAAILLLNTLVPRRGRTVVADDGAAAHSTGRSRSGRAAPAAAGAVVGAGAGAAYEHHRIAEEGDRGSTTDQPLARDRSTAGEPLARAREPESERVQRERQADAADTHVHR